MNQVNLRIINENLHNFLKEYKSPILQYFLRVYKISRFSISYISYNNTDFFEYVKPLKYKTKNKYIKGYNKN